MNRPEAEVIATIASIVRPAWSKASLMTLLEKHQHRPARQVALALIAMAYDPDVRTPGLLNTDHAATYWAVASPLEPTYTPPANSEIQCRLHGQRQPCGGCRADRLAKPTPTVEPPLLERAAGESLIEFAHRIADMRNTTEAALAATTEGEQQA